MVMFFDTEVCVHCAGGPGASRDDVARRLGPRLPGRRFLVRSDDDDAGAVVVLSQVRADEAHSAQRRCTHLVEAALRDAGFDGSQATVTRVAVRQAEPPPALIDLTEPAASTAPVGRPPATATAGDVPADRDGHRFSGLLRPRR